MLNAKLICRVEIVYKIEKERQTRVTHRREIAELALEGRDVA